MFTKRRNTFVRKKFIIATVPLALFLAACGGPTTPVGDKTGAESVKVTTKGNDTAPEVSFTTPINVNADTVKVLEAGDGETIKDGDHLMYRLAAYDGNTGKSIDETYSKKVDTPMIYGEELKAQSEALYNGLKDLKKGATIAFIPKAESEQQRGVMVLTITDVQHRPSEFKDLPAGAQFGDKKITQDITAKWGGDTWAPEVSIPNRLKPTAAAARLYGEGSGDVITEDTKVTFRTAITDIASGKQSKDTYPDTDPKTSATMAELKVQMPLLYEAIKGRKVGQTVVYVPKGNANEAPTAMVLTVTKAEPYHEPKVLSQAEVKKLRDSGKLPTVKENGDKKVPTVTIPAGKAPQDLVVETVKEGTGAVVKETDTIEAVYSGWAWDSKKNFDQNFTTGKPFSTPLSGVIKGWQKGLAGQKVGSTVMIVVPKVWAYGDQPQGDAAGDLIFYVKITKATAAK